MGSISEQKDDFADCDTSQPGYGQDLRADAVDTLLHLSPKSPGTNAFAAKAAAKHKQLISGNAFYQAHHKEEHNIDRDSSSTTITAINSICSDSGVTGIGHSRPDTPIHQSATILTPRSGTPTISRSGVTAGRNSDLSAISASARPSTPYQTPEQFMNLDIHLPSPTSVHPALHQKPPMTRRTTEEPANSRSKLESLAATRSLVYNTSATIPTRNTGHAARISSTYSSTPSAARQNVPNSPDASSDDPGKALSPAQSSIGPAKKLNASSSTAQEVSTSPNVTHRTADEKQLPTTPDEVLHSRILDHQTGSSALLKPAVMPLKLVPSPHIAQMAEPTQRAVLEQRKEQSAIEYAHSRTEAHCPKRASGNPNGRSASAFGYHNEEPKTLKKSSLFDRIKSGWRALPSLGGTTTAEMRGQSYSDTLGAAMGDGFIIHAQPKAQAILVGRSPSKPVPRSPSKRNFFRWKADESSSHVNFSRKISSPDPVSLSFVESSPALSPEIVQQDPIDAPTPPAKDTPLNTKPCPTTGLGLRGIQPASRVQDLQQPPRFGTYSRLEIAPLITNPNEHRYHASVIPELVNWEDLRRLTSRLEGLDLHGLPPPDKSSDSAMSPNYSPSLYSAEMGPNTAGFTPSLPRTRRSTMNSEARSALRDVLTASPQTSPVPGWTPNTTSGRKFETNSNKDRLDAKDVLQSFKELTTSLPHPVAPMSEHDTIHPQTSNRQTSVSHKSRAVSSATVTIAYPGLSSDPSMTKLDESDTAQPQLDRIPCDDANTLAIPERVSSLGLDNHVFTSTNPPDAKVMERDVFSDDPRLKLSSKRVGRGALPLASDRGHDSEAALEFPSPTPHALQKAILISPLQHLPTLPMTTFVEPLRSKRPKRASVSSSHSATLADNLKGSDTDTQYHAGDGTKGAVLRNKSQDCQGLTLPESEEKTNLDDIERDSTFEYLLDPVSIRVEQKQRMLQHAIARSKANDQASPQGRAREIDDQTDDHSAKNPDLSHPLADKTSTHTPSSPSEPSFITHHLSYSPSSPALESSPDITKGHSSRSTFKKTKRTRIITASHSGSPRQRKTTRGVSETAPRPTLEESLAQNRAYEERIAELMKRLEEVETRKET
jgi:hypothetical protein